LEQQFFHYLSSRESCVRVTGNILKKSDFRQKLPGIPCGLICKAQLHQPPRAFRSDQPCIK
jgi:hypothetical protein